MILIIKGELTDLNTYINAERTDKYLAAKIKKEETDRIYWEIKEQKLKALENCKYVYFYWYNKNTRKDFDNIEFAQKFIWDALVLARIIKNDNQKNTPPVRTHRHFTDLKNPRIEVSL
jgi:Holliday junction resolvase RusA-like endonuclease